MEYRSIFVAADEEETAAIKTTSNTHSKKKKEKTRKKDRKKERKKDRKRKKCDVNMEEVGMEIVGG